MPLSTGMNLSYSLNVGYNRQVLTFPVESSTTDPAVAKYFSDQIQILMNYHNKSQDGTQRTFTDQDYQNIENAFWNLVDLAQQGLNVNGKTKRINITMAKSIDELEKFFYAAGWMAVDPIIANLTKPQKVQALLDMASVGLGDALNRAIVGAKSYRSIQAQIELEYVRQGNDMLDKKLGDLQNQLTLIQDGVKALTTVQNLFNLVEPVQPSAYSQPGGTDPTTFYKNYQYYGDATFKEPIAVRAKVTDADRQTYSVTISELNRVANELEAASGVGPSNPTYNDTLQSKLRKIATSMQQNSLENWIRDNQGLPGTDPNSQLSGTFARQIAEGQTTAQSLNDSQKEEVRRTLFVFEEFYKSASTMLQAINDMITKLASLSRG